MSYRLSGFDGGDVTVDSGTNLLFKAPSAETEAALLDAVAVGMDAGEPAIVITTNRSAECVVEALAERDAQMTDQLGIVDCTSGEEAPKDRQGVMVRQLSSPGDLTGMSLEFAKLLQGFKQRTGGGGIRVGLATTSTLLMYNEVRTVFRFLHVFGSRIRSAELLGLFTLDPAMHDDQTTNTVRTIFDCEATHAEFGFELVGSGFDRA